VLAERIEFVPARDAEAFASAPAAPAVFLLRGDDPQAEPYVSKTANLRRRLHRLLGPPEHSRRLNLRDRVHWIEFTATGSDFESGFLLYRALRSSFPKTYSDRLRLRFAPLLKLHLENGYPRASITTRLSRLGGRSVYYGPFRSRPAAEKFANDSLDFFKMRRCTDDLHPDPSFPGCIYSEMKMCLAPCFKGCTDDEYRAEVARVQTYFDSAGDSFVREITQQRDQASTHLRIDRLTAIMVQPSAVPESVTFFSIAAGLITGPLLFPIQANEHSKSQSMESRVQATLATLPSAHPKSAIETMEHLALLKRWFYRSTREGEIFLADIQGGLPLRRLVRGIARVYRGEKPDEGIRM